MVRKFNKLKQVVQFVWHYKEHLNSKISRKMLKQSTTYKNLDYLNFYDGTHVLITLTNK